MEFEDIGFILIRGLLLQIFGQVDDVHGLKGAFLDTDSAPNAEHLAEVSDLGFETDLDAQLAQLNCGAGFLAFLVSFLGLHHLALAMAIPVRLWTGLLVSLNDCFGLVFDGDICVVRCHPRAE